MIEKNSLNILKNSKNLLAYSGGIDSSALFWLLLENGVSFDMAIVDYGIREQSKDEVTFAKKLALEFDKKLFVSQAPVFTASFEKNAREFRYAFFEEIIGKEGYKNLITAHQLDDMTEWFLMRFGSGAGFGELLGMDFTEERRGYRVVRPLLLTPKEELLSFLKEKNKKYFIDETNSDPKYKRNDFRQKYSSGLLKEYGEGIKKSFAYMLEDKKSFFTEPLMFGEALLTIFESQNDRLDIYFIDKELKKLGLLISKAQRDEIVSTKDCVISGKVAVVWSANLIFIAPYVKIKLEKKFKEECRKIGIPPKVRGYVRYANIDTERLKEMINV